MNKMKILQIIMTFVGLITYEVMKNNEINHYCLLFSSLKIKKKKIETLRW